MTARVQLVSKRGALLKRFRAALSAAGQRGQSVWLDALDIVDRDLESARVERDKKLYQELMLLESEGRALFAGRGIPAEDSARVLERIGKLKELLAVVCFVLISWGVVDLDFNAVRSMRSRRRDEEVLIG